MESTGKGILREALRQRGANELAHTGRTLEVHLVRTSALLRSWDCPEWICLAGMFHSVYGTNQFGSACLDLSERQWLIDLIGSEAERLVYLFCICARPNALLQGIETHNLVNRRTGDIYRVSFDDLQALLTIECANLLEQDAWSGFIETMSKIPLDHRTALLGEKVAHAISNVIRNKGTCHAK
jgi:hypothetical protein